MKAFKAYDIRGEWGNDLNESIAYRIGYFLPDILDTDTYLVGRDMRVSSETFFEALTRGLTDRGKNVDFIGLSTTPLVYWSTAKYGYGASIQITASHNPKHHNGLKISAKNALPVGYDTGLNRLEALVQSDRATTPCAVKGKITETPRGDNRFGYDPVIQPDGGARTFSELGEEEKNKLSHRHNALQKMINFLITNNEL